MLISFELTMPNRGSWNNRWSGEDRKYFIIENLSKKDISKKDHLNRLIEKGHDSWYYSWGDGWGASVTAEVVTASEAKKRREISAWFCGYDWMVKSILVRGRIKASHEIKEEQETVTSN